MSAKPRGLKSLIELLRFKDWWFQNGILLLGAAFSDPLSAGNAPRVAAGLAVSSLCLAHGHALNEYFDELRSKLGDDVRLAGRLHAFIYVLLAAALGLACFVSTPTVVIVALIGITSWLHSSPPLSLKNHIFWRLFLNSLGFSLFFLAGAGLNNQLSAGEMLLGGFIFTLYIPLELIHVLAHLEPDKLKGIRTFCLVYGQKRTIALASALFSALILYASALYLLRFASLAFAVWSVLYGSLMLLVLALAYRRDTGGEVYHQLRFRTKMIGVAYGAGLLVVFVCSA